MIANKTVNKRKIFFAAMISVLVSGFAFSQDAEYKVYLREGYTYDEIEDAERAAAESADVSPDKALMSSTSRVDWTKGIFVSDVSLDVVKAGIPMPSGKAVSMNRIQMELPILVKDPLLTL
ncbi:MAG: hypothetical protein II461_08335, partial [Treponema sp.]|nr:hypothetical protein [Treponema sp.]